MNLNRKAFLGQLEQLAPAIVNGSKIPALANMWFDGENAHAYNGGLGIMVPLATDFSFGVPGKLLLGIVGGKDTEEVEIRANGEGAYIGMGKSKVTLNTLPMEAVAWPYKLPKDNSPSITLTEDFIGGIRRVLPIQPTKKNRLEHYGVMLFAVAEGCLICTIDSQVLASYIVSPVSLPAAAHKIILPWLFAEQLVEQCKPGDVLYVLEDSIIALSDNVSIYSNLLDNTGLYDLPAMLNTRTTDNSS